MGRLIKGNHKSIQAQQMPPYAGYDFVFTLKAPNEIPQNREPINSSELAAAFKNWFVQNWIDQENNPEELKYIGLLDENIFDGWIRSVQNKYSTLYPYILEEAKFILRSERVLC
jgi:hypothetical protein